LSQQLFLQQQEVLSLLVPDMVQVTAK